MTKKEYLYIQYYKNNIRILRKYVTPKNVRTGAIHGGTYL
jgi:hypothetical protein